MRHIHADHMIAAANDTSIEWQIANPDQPHRWVDVTGVTSWSELLRYRQKPQPKKTVDMWQWACKTANGYRRSTLYYYRTENEVQREGDFVKLYRIEGSKITVEVDE